MWQTAKCLPVYNGPSIAIRPFVHLLHFFYILFKDLVVLFLHRDDIFYYVTHVTILGDKTTLRNTTKFQVKCTNT